jgi:hypothetical protein
VTTGPRLRPDITVVEQTYRGEQSFILKDPKARKYFRFRPVEVQVLQQFDGARSPADIAAELTEAGIRLSAATVEKFAAKLKTMGLLERTLGERSVLMWSGCAPSGGSGSRPEARPTSSGYAGRSAIPTPS